MKDSFEAVVEGVEIQDLGKLMQYLESKSREPFEVSLFDGEKCEYYSGFTDEIVSKMERCEEGIYVTTVIQALEISENLTLSIVLIRFFCVSCNSVTRIDMDMSFECEWGELDIYMTEIKEMLLSISAFVKVDEFFGGMEPASDIRTRYFTGTELGPLALNSRE
ncbi:hypothetical protein KUV41_10825 [Halomonas sp. DP8Y7-1]|uniref:hypothetical protein n=1 Tax=unclassified Halomonas TaxID=2609666 RepID=UPI001C952B3D|nr:MULTISPECIES: hypothetical protein [unclassified Halomonas]MBY5985486.1 hypothetical protein [Halomonas sp. DP5Y7-2]MBY6029850.1 hypothetical protein [Halomonas sp. DP8Y7-1]